MWRMLKDWAIALFITGAVLLIFSWWRKPSLPEFAPEIDVELLSGRSFALTEARGRPVVLNFWASWCGPCREEIPDFSDFSKEHPDVLVIGLAVDSGGPAEVARAARRLGITYDVALAVAAFLSEYDVDTLPTTVIVDGDGRVSGARVGAMSREQLERAVQ